MSITDRFKQPIRENKLFPFSDLIRLFTDTHQEAELVSSRSQTGCSFASCEEGIDEGVRQNQGDVWGSLPWNLQISAVPSDEKVMDDACQVTRLPQTGNIS